MIQFEQVALEFGDRLLFDDVTLTLTKKYRYVIVGANGAGKSSLLSVIAGILEPTLGTITTAKSQTLGWMRQDHHLYDDLGVVDVVIKGRTALWNALEEKDALLETKDWKESHSKKLAHLEEKIERLDGYRAHSDAESLLTGLGVKPDMQQKKLRQLSGGWKMRVLLAQLLFNNPDILLLDEPTNYLDIASIAWLEDYLVNTFSGLVLLVSHDQRFLEKVGTCILDLDYGQIQSYPGNYQKFLQKKEEIAEQKAKEFTQLEAKAARMKRFIERFKNKPSKAKQTSSREKMLEKLVWPELGRSSRESPRFSFQQEKIPGRIIAKAKGLCKIYNPDILIGPLDLQVERGERIAFIGENGAGKTTFLKLLTGQLDADDGQVEMGAKVETAIFEQEHKHLFVKKETVADWLDENAPGATDVERRKVLGAMLFRQDDVKKKITMLSGGEMARLLLGKIMLQKANFLILDEPTNHLDLESKEALENALVKFQGTVIFVSHDRVFIEKVATKVVEFTPKRI